MTAMVDIDVFLPQIMPIVPGCAEPTAINAVRQAAMRFCEATRAWRSEDEFEVTPDTCSFVCVPDQAELFEIEAVTFNGMPLDPAATSYLDRIDPTWRQNKEFNGSPKFYTQLAMDTIRIVPRAAGLVVVHAFLKPSEDADQVPEFLANKFRRIIASGALSDLLLLPGQPFFQPDLASVHSTRFQSALDRNFNLNVRGQQRAPTRTRAQFF